jgi:hypothetical protein
MNFLKFLIPLFFMLGCSSDIEIISIEREGSLIFNVEGYDMAWKSNEVSVYPGPSIVKVFPDNPDVSIIFKRHFFIFQGDIPGGGIFELTVVLDIGDEANMKHSYTDTYSKIHGGLAGVSLIMKNPAGTEIIYAELCPEPSTEAVFNIQRQDITDKLIAGNMEAILCPGTAPETKYFIYNADFKDIKYEIDL